MRLDLEISKEILYDKTFETQRFTAADGQKLSDYIVKHARDGEYVYGMPVDDDEPSGDVVGWFKGPEETVEEDMPLLLKDGFGRYFVFRLLMKAEKDGKTYCVFEPLTHFSNIDDGDVVVFRLCLDDDGSEYFAVETDDDVADAVIDELDIAFGVYDEPDVFKQILNPVTDGKVTIYDMNARKVVYRRLALIYQDGRYYGVMDFASSKGKENSEPRVFKIDTLYITGLEPLLDRKLEKQIMDEYESTHNE